MNSKSVRVKVRFFGDLVDAFQLREGEVELEGVPSIRSLLSFMGNSYARRQKVFDELGEIRPDLNILKNGRNIAFLNGAETKLSEGDTIAVFPRMFGG